MLKKLALSFLSFVLALGALTPIATANALPVSLISNPSVETASGTLPADWYQGRWGTNTSTFAYDTTGGNTGTKSLKINITKYTSGDAKWYFKDVVVKPNTKYTYSEFYKSNVSTELDIRYTNTSNKLSYVYLSNPAASATAWKQVTNTFTTPANVKTMTIFHVIDKVGTLQTDDFSLTEFGSTAPTAPAVSITSPAAGATVSGTQTLSADATDTIGMAGVQFKIDGVNVGSEDTIAPYAVSLDTKTVANGTRTISAIARNTSGLTATATRSINIQNTTTPTAPVVSITAPAASSTVSGTQTISANATDKVSVAGVQFKIDGANIGSEDTTAPYSVSLDTKTVTNGTHAITATARNASNLTTVASISVNVQNVIPPTAPTVSVTTPTVGATVSGTTQAISANAGDALGVVNVQFKLDGANLNTADTTAPYNTVWDTTKTTNGIHVLTAVATNTSNLSTTSASVSVTVNNVVQPPVNSSNLIANPSLETAQDTNTPQGWISGNWGKNTSTFSYLTTGHTGNRSVQVQTTQYSDGAANWYYAGVPVTAGKAYQYSNWYKSNVDTEVDAEVTMTDGSVQYYWLGTALANTNWTKFNTSFTVPAGAKSVAIFQILAKVGYIITDDYSLNEYTPAPFSRGIVTVAFDDGWTNQYTNANPIMKKYGHVGTYNVLSGELTNQPDYMNITQIKNLLASGNEIASHSITHPDLTTVSQAQLVQEMSQSQNTLQTALGVPIVSFAYPYGAYNGNTIEVGKQYYQSQRSVNAGYNSKDNLDLTQLKIYEVGGNISQAQVKSWIDNAIANKTWLILVYHEVATVPSDPSNALYTTNPADFDAEMSYLKNSGVAVKTIQQAVAEVVPQI